MSEKKWHTAACPAQSPPAYNKTTKRFDRLPCECGFEESQTPKAKKEAILAAGTLQRDETDSGWCDDCAKGSIWYGLAYLLLASGVDVWGTVRYCTECKKREWKDKKGIIRAIQPSNAPKEKDIHKKKEEEDVE